VPTVPLVRPKGYMTLVDVTEATGYSLSTVRRWCREARKGYPKLASRRWCHIWWISKRDLAAFRRRWGV